MQRQPAELDQPLRSAQHALEVILEVAQVGTADDCHVALMVMAMPVEVQLRVFEDSSIRRHLFTVWYEDASADLFAFETLVGGETAWSLYRFVDGMMLNFANGEFEGPYLATLDDVVNGMSSIAGRMLSETSVR